MRDVYPYLVPAKSPLVRKELLRSVLVYLAITVLISVTVYLWLLVRDYQAQVQHQDGEVTRSKEEFVNAGKRFLDYFLSVNSATVQFDKHRAISMMADEALRTKWEDYWLKTDTIRKAQKARMVSRVDWNSSEVKILDSSASQARVEYIVTLVLDRKVKATSRAILHLAALDRSDDFPDGVGVTALLDVASEPFMEEAK